MKGKQPLADHQAHSGLEELFDRSVLHDACAVGPGLCAVAAAAVLLPLAHAGCWCGRGCHRLARRSFARLPAHAGCRRGRRRRRRASRGFKRLGCILQERRLLPFGRGLALALLLLRHAAVRFDGFAQNSHWSVTTMRWPCRRHTSRHGGLGGRRPKGGAATKGAAVRAGSRACAPAAAAIPARAWRPTRAASVPAGVRVRFCAASHAR